MQNAVATHRSLFIYVCYVAELIAGIIYHAAVLIGRIMGLARPFILPFVPNLKTKRCKNPTLA